MFRLPAVMRLEPMSDTTRCCETFGMAEESYEVRPKPPGSQPHLTSCRERCAHFASNCVNGEITRFGIRVPGLPGGAQLWSAAACYRRTGRQSARMHGVPFSRCS